MTFKELKKKFKLKDTDMAEMFGYKNVNSYKNSVNGKKKVEDGLLKFYELMREQGYKKVEILD